MNIQFKKVPGDYTWITISDWLAITERDEITITGFLQKEQQYTYRYKGSKKEYIFPLLDWKCLLFEGHNLPLLIDSETNRYMGNACFNFITDKPKELKQFIAVDCINPDPETFADIMVTPALNRDTGFNPPYTPLFTDNDTE